MHADMDIKKVVAELGRMSVTDLRQRYADVFGEPARSSNKANLIKRIAWRMQALREGDLSERAPATSLIAAWLRRRELSSEGINLVTRFRV